MPFSAPGQSRIDLLRSHSDFLGQETEGETQWQDDWNRPGHHELLRGRPRGRRPDGPRERRGRADHPVGGGLHGLRRSPGGHGRQAPGRHEPREHDLLDQALHGPQGGRGQGGGDDRPLQGRRRPERRRSRRGPRQAVLAAGDLGDDPPEAEGGRRGEARRDRRLRGDHGPRVLQRRSAPGHQGRRQDRRPRGQADHQRADRRVARLRARQGGRPDDPRLRPRRRHLRRLGPRDRRRRVRGQVDLRRQPPRRRQLGQGDRRVDGRRVQARPGHRPLRRQELPPAPLRGRGEGEDRALHDAGDADQPAVHHRRRQRAEAPRDEAHAGEAERAHVRPARPGRRPGEAGAGRRRRRASTTSSSSAA